MKEYDPSGSGLADCEWRQSRALDTTACSRLVGHEDSGSRACRLVPARTQNSCAKRMAPDDPTTFIKTRRRSIRHRHSSSSTQLQKSTSHSIPPGCQLGIRFRPVDGSRPIPVVVRRSPRPRRSTTTCFRSLFVRGKARPEAFGASSRISTRYGLNAQRMTPSSPRARLRKASICWPWACPISRTWPRRSRSARPTCLRYQDRQGH